MRRENAQTAKPLSLAERKASVAAIAAKAAGKAKTGMELIDFREPSEKERAIAEKLASKARQVLARGARRKNAA